MNNHHQITLNFPLMSRKQFNNITTYLQRARYSSGEISGLPVNKPEEPDVHYIKVVIKLKRERDQRDKGLGFQQDITNILRLAGEIDILKSSESH